MAIQSIQIDSLKFQSIDISLTDWVILMALCLAPLLAHIVSGAPEPTYLSSSRPAWHDRMCHYHPTSILWRYAAIADRRIRARSWSPGQMAAANAIFHTAAGWDGSEEIAAWSIYHLVKPPAKTRVDLISWSTIKTAIITLQGAQAIAAVSQITFSYDFSNAAFSLDSLFFPIAIIGLLRLYPALWLTENFVYDTRDDVFIESMADPFLDISHHVAGETRKADTALILHSPLASADAQFRPSSSWRSRVFRIFFILHIAVLLSFTCFNVVPEIGHGKSFTTTTFLFTTVATLLLLASFIICSYYSVRSGFRSTIIPCLGSVWYKIYSCLSMFLAMILILVSAIETRRTPCGLYTTKVKETDHSLCPGLVYIGPNTPSQVLGLAMRANASTGSSVSENFLVVGFTGSCQGIQDPEDLAMFTNSSSSSTVAER